MSNRFKVIDGFNAYNLLDTVTGREACLGDGVGINFGNGTTDLECGMPGFVEAWEEEIAIDSLGFFEAYFHDLDKLVIYDNPKFMDRYTVILREATFLEKAVQSCGDLHHCLGLSTYPDSPQGFSQHSYASLEAMERMEAVHFLDLPENVQRHLSMRLEED